MPTIPVSRLLAAASAFLLLPCLAVGQLAPESAPTSIQARLTREQRDTMAQETLLALQNLQSYHYRRQNLAQVDAAEVLREYMRTLDYARLFFTEEDTEAFLVRFEKTLMSSYLLRGNLFPAFEVFDTFRQRLDQRLAWVQERLKGDFDFGTDGTYAWDRSESPWPADVAEADALWERRLTFELLQELLAEQTLDEARNRVSRRYQRIARFYGDFEPSNVQESFLTAITGLFDPHSQFMSASSMEDFYMDLRNSLVGIGALLRDEDGVCVIQELIPGGPAELSGQIHPGDRILEVAQGAETPVDVLDMRLSNVVKMIRGAAGTEVRLTIRPGNATDLAERKVVTIVRDEIKLTANLASARVYDLPVGDRSVSVGVIDLPAFYGGGPQPEGDEPSTTPDVEELIGKLKERGVSGLVLDLRRNPGGLLNEAVSLAGLFIPRGPIVQVRDTTGRVREDWDRDRRVAWDGPLVVLTSLRSASASEIVAGALKDHGRAVLVGERSTHGKGTVQVILELNRALAFNPLVKPPALGATKVTIQKFYLPFGESTQNEGVKPHIALPSINDHLEIGEADLRGALPWDAIAGVDFNPRDAWLGDVPSVDEILLGELQRRSADRLGSLEEFAYLRESISHFAERQNLKEVSLNLELRRRQREEDKAFAEAMRLRAEELARTNFASTEVLLDLASKTAETHQEQLRSTPLPDGQPRANRFFQKVFYHLDPATNRLHEVWAERIDYERARQHAGEIATLLSQAAGAPVPESGVADLLGYLANADRASDFAIESAFAKHLGDALDRDRIEGVLPAFFGKMIELDPTLLTDQPVLDIPLREGLRVLGDWIELRGGAAGGALARVEPASPATPTEPPPAARATP